MTSNLNTTTTKILTMVAEDRRVCGIAKKMLIHYAKTLESGELRNMYDLADEFAGAPPTYSQILDQWDGEDPANGLAHYETILEAMRARIVECNLEKLTNKAVQKYWDLLDSAICDDLVT